MDLDDPVSQVHHPHLRDAGAGVQGQLYVTVVGESSVRNLYHQEHVFGAGRRPGVGARALLEEAQVRLGLVPTAKRDRVLGADEVPARAGCHQ